MRQIDSKYKTSGDITRLDGTPIPHDEPLILFRGQDKLVIPTLEYYLKLRTVAGSSSDHLELLRTQMNLIRTWQHDNPKRLRIPR